MRTLRRIPFRVVVPVLLMAVLGVLAALQYHWLGQVSRAERQRMHETMTARAQGLASDIDREVSRVYVSFQLREPELGKIDRALSERYKVWRETSRHPDLVTAIYVFSPDGSLEKFDPTTGTLSATEWPDSLKPLRDRSRSVHFTSTTGRGAPVSVRLPQTISTDPLAVSVLLPFSSLRTHPGTIEAHRAMTPPGALVLVLDRAKLVGDIVPRLVAQHLGDSLDEYRLSIVEPRTGGKAIYVGANETPIVPEQADVRVNALVIRSAINERLLATELRAAASYAAGLAAARGTQPGTVASVPPLPPPAPRPGAVAAGPTSDRVTLFVEQREIVAPAPSTDTLRITAPSAQAGGRGGAGMMTIGAASGWQVLLKHRAGSLEAAVERVRLRNLVMSFGMLALLAASVGLVLASARRAERLASQQMDFVATVSHELRTPLAVIRSAGQNLSAGVVHDTKRYGELIETEGRRLTDMVEQTLALAGLSGNRKPVAQHPIDAGDLVRGVLASPETSDFSGGVPYTPPGSVARGAPTPRSAPSQSRAGGVEFDVRIADDLPMILADEMLVRRGVQNLVANALKYGAAGRWVGVTVDAGASRRGREVRITVSDRGPGVAAEDLPHIFEAFYRGRKAVADQVQGNGLGLHLVKRIAEAHGGRVTVRTAPGAGAAFTIHIPARGDLAVPTLAGEQPQTS